MIAIDSPFFDTKIKTWVLDTQVIRIEEESPNYASTTLTGYNSSVEKLIITPKVDFVASTIGISARFSFTSLKELVFEDVDSLTYIGRTSSAIGPIGYIINGTFAYDRANYQGSDTYEGDYTKAFGSLNNLEVLSMNSNSQSVDLRAIPLIEVTLTHAERVKPLVLKVNSSLVSTYSSMAELAGFISSGKLIVVAL